jgi:hypothetical protein
MLASKAFYEVTKFSSAKFFYDAKKFPGIMYVCTIFSGVSFLVPNFFRVKKFSTLSDETVSSLLKFFEY